MSFVAGFLCGGLLVGFGIMMLDYWVNWDEGEEEDDEE